MTQHDPLVSLRQMLEYAEAATRIAGDRTDSEILDDEVVWHALVRVIEVVGEAASRLSADERPPDPDVPWPQIVGMRNFLAHAYDQLNPDAVLRTLREDIPQLTEALRRIIARIEQSRED